MILHVFLKEQVQDVALLMPGLIFNIMFVRQFFGFFCRADGIKIHIGIFLHCLYHCEALKRLGQIHGMFAISNDF